MAIPRGNAPIGKDQRRTTVPYALGLVLIASVFAALVLSATRAEAELSTEVTFGNKSANYSYAGNTAVLTAQTIHNYSFNLASAALRMELWALPAPFSGGTFAGYKLAQYPLAPLTPGAEYTDVNSGTIAFTPPPSGTWYFVMVISELSGASFDDGYTIDNWIQLCDPPNRVRRTTGNGNRGRILLPGVEFLLRYGIPRRDQCIGSRRLRRRLAAHGTKVPGLAGSERYVDANLPLFQYCVFADELPFLHAVPIGMPACRDRPGRCRSVAV